MTPTPQARARAGFGADERSQYQYWARLADPRLRFRNCGVFGERTDEIAERLEQCAGGAEVLVIQGGINDIAQSLGGTELDRFAAVEEAAANLREMVRRGKRLGLEVEIADVLPWNNGHPYATPHIDRSTRRSRRSGRGGGPGAALPRGARGPTLTRA